MNDAAFEALRRLYAEVDRAVRATGPECDLSGRCCRFREYGHTLHATALEAAFAAAGANGRAAPAAEVGGRAGRREPPRFALARQPVRPDEPPERYEPCPFLAENGACGLRGHRPLGCRVFFCDPAFQAEAMPRLHEKFLARLRRLHEVHGLPWRYAPFPAAVRALLS